MIDKVRLFTVSVPPPDDMSAMKNVHVPFGSLAIKSDRSLVVDAESNALPADSGLMLRPSGAQV